MSTPPSVAVSIGRMGIFLPPLVIRALPRPGAPWWLPEDGVGEIGFSWRIEEAPESAYFPGTLPLGAVLDATALPLVVYAQRTATETLEQIKRTLEQAFAQWRYRLVLDLDGERRDYIASPAWPKWEAQDSGMAEAGMARCVVTVPINPEGA